MVVTSSVTVGGSAVRSLADHGRSGALDALVGVSAQMRALRERLPLLARSDCNVLITGETGTGKDCVARAVHELSRRRDGPLMCINCAALPDSLLDSELFGFEKGSFTGATAAYPGKVALAHGGTLFLDEIGDMPPHAQAKLLRVIETREVFPIGAVRARHVDVRIVAATHCALERAVREQRFRADLFYRLNVARVELPPLRERPDDVIALFEHFARQLADANRAGALRLTPAALQRLRGHDWPGNARELRSFVEAAGIDFDGTPLDAHDLPLAGDAPACCESTRILHALEECQWNRSKTAQMLRWSRMTLYRKMKQLRIEPASPVRSAPL